MSAVPCNTCRACCTNQLVMIMPEDEGNIEAYDFREMGPIKVLKTLPNGDCVHLGEAGCTIYNQRPVICRAYDCRKQFKIMARWERRQLKNKQIWKEARKRLNTLDDGDSADLARYREAASGRQERLEASAP